MDRQTFDSLAMGDKVWWGLRYWEIAGISRGYPEKIILTRTDIGGEFICSDWLEYRKVKFVSHKVTQ